MMTFDEHMKIQAQAYLTAAVEAQQSQMPCSAFHACTCSIEFKKRSGHVEVNR